MGRAVRKKFPADDYIRWKLQPVGNPLEIEIVDVALVEAECWS